jgi:hypothetical protein
MAKNPTQKQQSTQKYIDIREIRDGVVILSDGSLRRVILCSTINFELKNEDEQNAIVYAYQGFLNSLTFPIQIVVQSRILDLGPYLAKLNDRKKLEPNDLLKLQISDYIDFVKRLIEVTNVMDKKFYIVVPFTPAAALTKGLFAGIFGPAKTAVLSEAQFKAGKDALDQRVMQVISRLAPVGIRAVPLETEELIELFYDAYNPETAATQKISAESELTSEIVEKSKE